MTAVLDLRGAARRVGLALEPDALVGLDEAGRQIAVATWRGRMVNEYVSARVFTALADQLERADLGGARAEAVRAMADEERRHGELCAAAVEALGGEAVVEHGALPPVPRHDEVAPLEGLLRNVISVSCLSETVAVALIDAERRTAGPPALGRLLAGILADEVGHARFGWRLLGELAPGLDAGLRGRLGDYLVVAFAGLVDYELSNLPARPAPSAAAEALGVCDGVGARALFLATVEEVIVPGLEAHGLAAGAAWRAAQVIGAAASAPASAR